MLPENELENFELFRDALSNTILQNIALDTPKERRRAKGRQGNSKNKSKDNMTENSKPLSSEKVDRATADNNDTEDLAEFIDVRTPILLPHQHRS